MRYTGVLLLLTALCFVSCTGKKDFKDGIFHARFYDGTESSHSRIRNIKCTVHKTLQDTPFDVVRDASGNFRLVLKR